MALHTQLCLVLFGTCLFSILLLLECRMLKGYDFPVYLTKKCPGNQAEWKNRSSAINCTERNGYMCLPNENFTDLLEFCYIYPRILVQKDLCLYLAKRVSRVNSYNCRKFTHGCPELHYFSSETYVHPSCVEIENGCFSAEPSCKRQPLRTENPNDDTTLVIILGVSIPACYLCIMVFNMILRKYRISKRRRDIERYELEMHSLFHQGESEDNYKENLKRRRNRRRRRRRGGRNRERYEEKMINLPLSVDLMDKYEESPNEKAMFDQWEQDDSCFISTKACEEVDKLIKSRNLVTVAGHSGSGKSAIIQHIALKYRKQGWTVRRVTKVEDIEYHLQLFEGRKTFFVLNDPFGKESCDEILINSWQMCEGKLKYYLIGAKLLMSCRNNIMYDTRVPRYLLNQKDIVDIDSEKYKLSVNEKRHILTRYTSDMNLSDNECDEIVEAERYFPLLCKLYSSKEYKNKDMIFFTEPETVLKDVILEFQKKDQGKYCALALIFVFNDDLCTNDLLENKDTENKFKHTLKLCGLPENTSLSAIEDNLQELKDFLVLKVGDKYRFCHDFVMEVTTHVFVTEYPDETIEYADIGLLRKRVGLLDCKELNENYLEKLGERFFNELIGNRFMDVVLNPCMKKKKMIEVLKKIIQKNPEKLQLLFKKKEHNLKTLNRIKQLYVSKLTCISFKKDITPLFALIVFGHTDFSLECLKSAQQIISNSIDSSLFHAVCCNGSMKLFHIFSEDHLRQFLKNKVDNTWGELYPIHTLSLYHNYEIIEKLIKIGVKINSKSGSRDKWTPLLLAVGNDTQKYGDYDHEESGATRRDNTVQLLLSNGADINLCTRGGTSPLYIACKNGHDSTVQILLSNGADITLCNKNGESPFRIACKNGHESTVQLFQSNGADINLCNKNETRPLFIACRNNRRLTV